METAAAAGKKGRRRQAKKLEGGAPGEAAAGGSAGVAAAASAGRPWAIEEAEHEEDAQPRPSLAQRLTKSLKQLSQLGATPKNEVRAC
jgi:hypothetical protein